jgi:hypothetical protein
MENEKQSEIKLETETCSRCGGSGKYSYCQMYGDTCFKCRGAGKVYTKRGQAAVDFLRTLRSKRADQFKTGELFYMESGPFNKGGFCQIESIRIVTAAEAQAAGNSYKVDTMNIRFTAESKMGGFSGLAAGSMHRRALTAAEKSATMQQALDYQDTLTKQGTVRKNRGWNNG